MFGERIAGETPELDQEGVRMRFIGRREGIDAELVERMEWAEEDDRRTTDGSRSLSPSTTAAGRRSSTRRETSRVAPRRSFAATSTRPRCTIQTS